MKRGEIWTISGGPDYASKPRPAVIVQDDRFDENDSITVCPITTDPSEAPLIRILAEPTDRNGLRSPSRLMVDKITTLPRSKLGRNIGRLDADLMGQLARAAMVFLGLAGSRNTGG